METEITVKKALDLIDAFVTEKNIIEELWALQELKEFIEDQTAIKMCPNCKHDALLYRFVNSFQVKCTQCMFAAPSSPDKIQAVESWEKLCKMLSEPLDLAYKA